MFYISTSSSSGGGGGSSSSSSRSGGGGDMSIHNSYSHNRKFVNFTPLDTHTNTYASAALRHVTIRVVQRWPTLDYMWWWQRILGRHDLPCQVKDYSEGFSCSSPSLWYNSWFYVQILYKRLPYEFVLLHHSPPSRFGEILRYITCDIFGRVRVRVSSETPAIIRIFLVVFILSQKMCELYKKLSKKILFNPSQFIFLNLLKPVGYFTHHQVKHSKILNGDYIAFKRFFLWLLEQTATFALYIIKKLIFITQVDSV